MNIEQEIRDQIERNKELKQEVGYINNHLSILEGFCREDKQKQIDDAYKRGLEDGKKSKEKGCEGCKYELYGDTEDPCWHCRKSYKDKYEPAPHSDRIEVGDEVTHKSDSVVWKAVCIRIDGDGRHMNLMGHTGAVGYYPVDDFKKTGRHFDIPSIMEELRNG